MLLITGISGFVGEAIARHFAARGLEVAGTYLTRPIDIPGVNAICVDLSNAEAVRRLIAQVHPAAVIHCAAATKAGWCEEHPAAARAAIVDATAKLCDSMARMNSDSPFLHISTDLVFDGEAAAPYAEDAPGKPLNVYGSLKWQSEAPVRALTRGIVMRSALVYGPPGTNGGSFLGWMVDALKRGAPLPLFRDEWRTPIFVDDLARAAELLLSSAPAEKIFHAGGPDRLSRVEMGEWVCSTFGLSRESMVMTERNASPGGALRARDVSLSCKRLHALGWKPTSFCDGLKLCLDRWKR